jgi:selenocysteine lyase/cysteine desulfurase
MLNRFFSRLLSKSSTTDPENAYFTELRKTEYAILDQQSHTYLDVTGGNLYPRSLVLKHQEILLNNVLGNPHSTNPTSQRATELVESTRKRVLQFFRASEDYHCIFTQNASGAMKIVGESYPFSGSSHLVLLADNHNSVNGIREFCRNKGGQVEYVPVNFEDLQINENSLNEKLNAHKGSENSLFAFPGQSNVSGVKHDLNWIKKAKDLGYDVFLDAAALVPSTRLDLSVLKPDFVSVSFYKIFGYPTGIGCLLVHKNAFPKLQKPWFAGGTVSLVSVVSQDRFLAGGHERFEDGTLSYNNIPAVKLGLDFIEGIGMERITARVSGLIQYLVNGLKELHHENGKPLVKIFGPEDFPARGGNIILNFFDALGEKHGFESIESMANRQNISIRSGCFCNPGIDEINNCLTNQEIATYFTSRDHGNYYDMIQYLGKMRGATRVSVGIATSYSDLDRFIGFAKRLLNKNAEQILMAA